MQDRPAGIPADADLTVVIGAGWDVDPSAIDFLPTGLDPKAAGFAVTAVNGDRWFLKVRLNSPPAASALVPQHLRRLGLASAVAPVATTTGQPWLKVGNCYALLYPFVDAPSVWDMGMSDNQWNQLGSFVGQMHSAELPPDVVATVPTDTYESAALSKVRDLTERLRSESGPVAELWWAHFPVIDFMLDRMERLGATLAKAGLPRVLCHGDLHGGNVLARPAGPISVVDWDTPLFAPRERDMIFVIVFPFGARYGSGEAMAQFGHGYGRYGPRQEALAYYSYERVLDDIQEFAKQVLDPAASDAARQEGLGWLDAQFKRGGGADQAQEIDPYFG